MRQLMIWNGGSEDDGSMEDVDVAESTIPVMTGQCGCRIHMYVPTISGGVTVVEDVVVVVAILGDDTVAGFSGPPLLRRTGGAPVGNVTPKHSCINWITAASLLLFV
jgi:hypothetical protein